ncbi:MAG TPA: hypothetical protein PKD61_15280, partial [Polyangiaceae bacterium]|nr:hypothetical protein [Polyangiaceae bacterium]
MRRSLGAFLPRSSRFVLDVVAGPDRGAQLELDPAAPQQFLVGQSATCALTLTDPLVSRRHVALSV